jgi:hypothetical protein
MGELDEKQALESSVSHRVFAPKIAAECLCLGLLLNL